MMFVAKENNGLCCNHVKLFLFVCFGILLQCFLFYPGYIYWDSWVQLSQALGLRPMTDWHPPIMTLFWRTQIALFGTEKIFYILNIFIFWAALFLLLKNFNNRYLGFIAFLIGFLPFIVTYIAVPIKDVSFAVCIFLCCALLANIEFSSISMRVRNFTYIIIIILILYCTLTRVNSIFITAPLIVFIFFEFKNTLKIYLVVLCLIASAVFVTPYINNVVFGAEKERAIRSLLLFDIAGISFRSKENLFGIVPDKIGGVDINQKCYTPKFWDSYSIYAGTPECAEYGKKIFTKDDHYLLQKWGGAIKKHPLSYLRHRISVFNRFINYQGKRSVFQYRYGEYPGIALYPAAENAVIYKRAILSKLNAMASGRQIWFAPYFWLSLLIGLFIATIKCSTRKEQLVNVIAFSAGIYLLGFFSIGVSDGYRYAYPSVLMCLSAILLYIKFKSMSDQTVFKDKFFITGMSFSVLTIMIGCLL